MTTQEIEKFWGRDNLIRWSPSELADVAIPASAKRFLADVGLPIGVDWTLQFDRESGRSLPPELLCVGFDDPVPICLDQDRGGAVVAVEFAVRGSMRFINSTVEQFAECLIHYQRYRTTIRRAADDEIVGIIDLTNEAMRSCDPAAFAHGDNYWPLIIEQMNQGLI